MNPINLFIALFSWLPLSLYAAPEISLDISRFKGDSGPFIEVSLYTIGSSLRCDTVAESEYGISYMILIRDESSQVIAGNRYKLSNRGCPAQDIIDVRRFALSKGTYQVEVEAYDLSDTSQQITVSQEVIIGPGFESEVLSDIQLLSVLKPGEDGNAPLYKSGLYMEPLAFRLYYPSLHSLYLYIESYMTTELEGQPYMQYTIKPAKGDIPPPIVAYKRLKKESVAANVFQLDISTLMSGSYILEAALYDGQKQIIAAKKADFARYNPKGDSLFLEVTMNTVDLGFVQSIPEDSIDYILKAMLPVVNSYEVDVMNVLLQKGNMKAKRYFIHRYWTQEAGKFAGPAYFQYMKVARAIDANYRSGFGYGFETDRGHIFLKYGKPDDVIQVEDEPSAPPYEIWFYNTFPATHQNNVRFLFYNPNLTTNGHRLLHSTANGEIRNERWEIELYRDATHETPGVNERVMGDNVHRNARRYFEN